MVASKQARAYIEKEICDYKATKTYIKKLEKEIIQRGSTAHWVPAKFGAEAKSMFVTHRTLLQMQNFVEAFESVFYDLPEEKQRMIYLLYWSNKNLTCNGVGMEIFVDGATVGRWRKSILNKIAERMGLT